MKPRIRTTRYRPERERREVRYDKWGRQYYVVLRVCPERDGKKTGKCSTSI